MAFVRTEDEDQVRRVIINRPEKRNALSLEVYRELGEAFGLAAADDDVLAVVVSGEGAMFSAGNDVRELAGAAEDPAAIRRSRPVMLGALTALEEMSKPSIAVLHGACIGGACELALACDLRIMADDAVIGLFETKLGLVPDLGGCSRLPAVVGLGRAKEMVMTARALGADEALRIGLVNRVAPSTGLEAATGALLDELLANAPRAVGLAKRILDAAAKPALSVTLELEVATQELLAGTADFREGAGAVAAKRAPQFTGR